MIKYNLISVINSDGTKHLMCKRAKEPFKDLFNFVGGKVEDGELSLNAAYRELFEETGISKDDIAIEHLLDLTYYKENFVLEIYMGKLTKEVKLVEEVNELVWLDIEQNYENRSVFAGLGNMSFIMSYIKSVIKNEEI